MIRLETKSGQDYFGQDCDSDDGDVSRGEDHHGGKGVHGGQGGGAGGHGDIEVAEKSRF